MSVTGWASPDEVALEQFIEDSLRASIAAGYVPTRFLDMRGRRRTKDMIIHLVSKGEIQSGFKEAIKLNLAEWTLEAAVLKFPALFSRHLQKAARWRRTQAGIVLP